MVTLPDAAALHLRNVDATSTRRSAKYRILEWQRDNTSRAGQRSCMHALGKGVSIGGTSSGNVHVSGAIHCASPWACMVCSPAIAETRAASIDARASEHLEAGGHLFFVTATLRHQHGDDLFQLLETLQESWSQTWRFFCRPWWYGGQVRTVEITYGAHGWHPHVHALLFVPLGECHEYALGEFESLRFEWERALAAHGASTDVRSDRSPGWDVRPVTSTGDLASYLTKVEGGWGVGLELTRHDLKKKGTTPFDLLARAAAGDSTSAKLWSVYERATSGRRRVVASPGLMHLESDDEAVVSEIEEDPNVLVYVPSKAWHRLLHSGRAGDLFAHVARLAIGATHEWPYPPGWLLRHHASSSIALAA